MKLQMENYQPGKVNKNISFLLTAPGITPVYKNNPGFRIVSIDTKRKVVADYNQYYMDLVLTTRKYSHIYCRILIYRVKSSVRNSLDKLKRIRQFIFTA